MDMRTYQPKYMAAEVAEASSDSATAETDEDRPRQKVHILPGPVDDDLQEMLDRRVPVLAREQADMALCFWGMAAWRRDGGDRIDVNTWRERLAEARQRTSDGMDITEVARGGPGFVAAVCVRDHWQEMQPEDRSWCINILIGEIERDCNSNNMSVQVALPAWIRLDRQPTYYPRSCMKVHLMRLMNE